MAPTVEGKVASVCRKVLFKNISLYISQPLALLLVFLRFITCTAPLPVHLAAFIKRKTLESKKRPPLLLLPPAATCPLQRQHACASAVEDGDPPSAAEIKKRECSKLRPGWGGWITQEEKKKKKKRESY